MKESDYVLVAHNERLLMAKACLRGVIPEISDGLIDVQEYQWIVRKLGAWTEAHYKHINADDPVAALENFGDAGVDDPEPEGGGSIRA